MNDIFDYSSVKYTCEIYTCKFKSDYCEKQLLFKNINKNTRL